MAVNISITVSDNGTAQSTIYAEGNNLFVMTALICRGISKIWYEEKRRGHLCGVLLNAVMSALLDEDDAEFGRSLEQLRRKFPK